MLLDGGNVVTAIRIALLSDLAGYSRERKRQSRERREKGEGPGTKRMSSRVFPQKLTLFYHVVDFS